ncbi:MAG: family 20 glycosylhydrolase [Bacteroidales bacterium]|nr:family 20 glycosylhydrolase [Bacteroidales bacterium]MBR5081992.1 family 20 glycosylhydrolase [Bacteroidales bacterium]
MMHKLSIFILLLALAACTPQPPTAEWTEGATEANGQALHTLVLHNVPEGSRVWFQELFDGKTMVEGPAMHHYQGSSWYIDIPSNDSLGRIRKSAPTVTLKYHGRPLPRQRWAPEAFILQQKGKPDMPMEVQYHFLELPPEEAISEDFACRYEVQPADIIPQIKRIQYGIEPMESTETHPYGWYRITIDTDGNPSVEADDEDGAYYAQVTLNKLPKPLQPMTLEDWPDFPYRGFMLDVARDFRTVDEVLEIIDLMASWKMNVLHFHIADDESWCLEIKALPELTEFGGRHALPDWDLQESIALKPTINGHIGNATFYTAEEYQQIIRYAWDRRISVIPEFDTPGHSRASIKAMQAYERRTGNSTYRLQDPADTSHYWSAQDFTDNVLSVELPSVYHFYGLVFDEVIQLHQEANVPLPAIHIGGDEVPDGAWTGKDRHEMKETFINGMLDLAEQRNIRLAGWEDIARDLEPETEVRLKRSLYFINVWNTEGIEGFPVVLSPASYTYLDLAYSADPREIGLHWAGYVDERKTFDLDPNDYKGDILGVQAQLWSSQLRSFDDATYQMLPKALGIAEHGWNSQTNDFNRFYNIIVDREMPVWEKNGFAFKKR